MVFRFAVTSAAVLLTAMMHSIDGRPRATFRLFLGHAALLVTLFYVLGLPFLLIRVFVLIASWHFRTSSLIPKGSLWLLLALANHHWKKRVAYHLMSDR